VVLWTAGVGAPPVGRAIAEATGAPCTGRLASQVGDDLHRPGGHPEISVVGEPDVLAEVPGMAEVGHASGYLGPADRRFVVGSPPAGRSVTDLGSAPTISPGPAVLSAGPLKLGASAG